MRWKHFSFIHFSFFIKKKLSLLFQHALLPRVVIKRVWMTRTSPFIWKCFILLNFLVQWKTWNTLFIYFIYNCASNKDKHFSTSHAAFQGNLLARKLQAGTWSESVWYEFTGSELRDCLPFQGISRVEGCGKTRVTGCLERTIILVQKSVTLYESYGKR